MTIQPQILAVDGIHNSGGADAIARFDDTRQWKRQRVVVILPASDLIPAKVALSHWSLIFPPNNGVYRMLALGMEVGEAYTSTFHAVLNHPDLSTWEYILTIEHDNIPPSDGVLKLVASMDKHKHFTALSGLYWTKGEGGVPQIWGDVGDPVLNFRPQSPVPDSVQECCGLGMGFCLWSIPRLKEGRLPDPLFKTLAGDGGCTTQDLYFWSEARKHGHRCAVDTSVKVGHYEIERDLVW